MALLGLFDQKNELRKQDGPGLYKCRIKDESQIYWKEKKIQFVVFIKSTKLERSDFCNTHNVKTRL